MMPAYACLLLCAPLAAAAPDAQVEPSANRQAGISLPEDRALATRLDDARGFLAEERWPEAVSALLEVEEADPGAIVEVEEGFFRGAAAVATEMLNGLPPEGQAIRRQQLEPRLEQALAAASMPPNALALEVLAQRGAGLAVGDQARAMLQDLWRDRGYPDRAAAYGAGPLPAEILRRLPPADARADHAPALLDGEHRGELPHLDLKDLSPAWSFRFQDVSPLRSWGHRVVTGNGLVYASNGREVVALELDSGKARWRFDGPPGWAGIGVAERDDISGGASPYTLLAPVLADGVLLVVLQEPWSIGRSDQYSRIHIRRKLPARRLYAFDAFSGAVLWRQEVPWADAANRVPQELAAGPPAVVDGRVFLPVYTASGTVDLSLQARDLRSGQLLWQRFLISGHLETNLFGNVLSELAVPPPTADLERVFVCTHLGAVCALDAATGRALWTHLYPRTPVRTRQNGQMSNRPQWFHNGAMAYDGQLLVAAPIDCFETIAYQASNGRVVERYPARADRSYGSLSNLIGLGPQGAYYTGLAAVRLPLLPSMPPPVVGPSVYEYATTDQFNLQPGLILADGLLSPGSQRLLWLDTDSLREREEVLSWQDSSGARIGPLAATDGWLFVMTRIGIEAFASPSALVARLTAEDLDLATLDRLLPLLDAFDFRRRPGLGRRAAHAASALAEREPFRLRAEALQLLAGRIWLLLDEAQDAIAMLRPLLHADEARLRLDAAGLLLDAPPLDRDGERARAEARELLLSAQPALVRTRDQSYEPLAAVLAQAAWHRALALKDQEAQRQALVQVLLLGDCGRLLEGGRPLRAAAADALATMLRQDDEARHRHQEEAAAWLEAHAANEAFLRAYGNTPATQDWLAQALHAPNLARRQAIRLLNWVHRYGDPERSWPALEALFVEHPEAVPLPSALEAKVQVRLDGMSPLQVVGDAKGVDLYLQDRGLCRLFRLQDGQAHLTATVPFIPDQEALPGLQRFTFAVDDGLVLIFGDQWVHIDRAGERQSRLLPGVLSRISPLVRVGDLAAFLVEGATAAFRLVLVDLQSGEVFLDRPVEGAPDGLQQIVANDHWLFLLRDRSPEVTRVDLRHWQPLTTFNLPFVPHYSELMAARPFGNGIAIPASRGSHGSAIHLLEPGLPTRTLPLDGLEFNTFPVPHAFGWWTRPLGRLGEAPQARTLNLLTEDSPRPWQLLMPQAATRLLPFSGRSSWRKPPPSREVVVAEAGANGGTRLRAFTLGGSPERWRLELPELAFDLLEEPQPYPIHGADGWVVLLRESGLRRDGPRLHVLRIDERGQLLGRYDSPRENSSRAAQELLVVPGAVLLRHGDAITLLQD